MRRDLLPAEFFRRPAIEVAPDLLGCRLDSAVGREQTGGIISEVEAYHQHDPASHSFRGPTERNRSMFLSGGHLYVYLIYGIHFCMNVVTGEEGTGEAVLIRGLRPDVGIEVIRGRRGSSIPDRELTNGPGKVAQALAVSRAHDGSDLRGPGSLLTISRGVSIEPAKVLSSERIGISKGKDRKWRWYIERSTIISSV